MFKPNNQIRSFKTDRHKTTHGDNGKDTEECPKCDNYMTEDDGYYYCKNCYWAGKND